MIYLTQDGMADMGKKAPERNIMGNVINGIIAMRPSD
jgi:hypothetical protein